MGCDSIVFSFCHRRFPLLLTLVFGFLFGNRLSAVVDSQHLKFFNDLRIPGFQRSNLAISPHKTSHAPVRPNRQDQAA